MVLVSLLNLELHSDLTEIISKVTSNICGAVMLFFMFSCKC